MVLKSSTLEAIKLSFSLFQKYKSGTSDQKNRIDMDLIIILSHARLFVHYYSDISWFSLRNLRSFVLYAYLVLNLDELLLCVV